MGESVADGELVRRIAEMEAGEPASDAEAELCRRFAPRVRLYGLRHLRSEEHAADLVQGVLLEVLVAARAGRIQELDHVDRFVLGTCRNRAHRVRANDARLELTEPTEMTRMDLRVVSPDHEHVDAGRLMVCVSKLDERSRTVVLLSFQAEQHADEIASALDITAGNVRVLRHRALLQLRRCIDGAEEARP